MTSKNILFQNYFTLNEAANELNTKPQVLVQFAENGKIKLCFKVSKNCTVTYDMFETLEQFEDSSGEFYELTVPQGTIDVQLKVGDTYPISEEQIRIINANNGVLSGNSYPFINHALEKNFVSYHSDDNCFPVSINDIVIMRNELDRFRAENFSESNLSKKTQQRIDFFKKCIEGFDSNKLVAYHKDVIWDILQNSACNLFDKGKQDFFRALNDEGIIFSRGNKVPMNKSDLEQHIDQNIKN